VVGHLFSAFQTLLRRRQFEDGMAEEMCFHIDQYTADLVRSGVPAEEAARRARREFGHLDNLKEDCREASGLRLFDEIQQDARYAVRLMRKTPGFTATALLTLALCLGANLTIFAVVDSVLLRPLPFPAGDRLVSVYNTYPKAGVPNDGCSLANYYERRGQIPAFSGLAIYRDATAVVGEAGTTDQIPVSRVSPDFFSTLGLGPVKGRTFTEAETADGKNDAAILTDSYWRQQLGADPRVLGRVVRVNGIARTVVGILPPRFSFLSSQARIYMPLASSADERAPQQRHSGTARMIARLRPGATLAEAQAQIDARNAAVEVPGPEARMMADAGFRSRVVSLRADHVATVRPTLLLVQAGALFLLLIGGVNLVNLLLIRASGRVKELAVRQALGASRRHLVIGALVESTLLALTGGLLGLAAGAGGIRLLAFLGVDRLPLGSHVAFDGVLALTALAGSLAVGIALGLPVAWLSLRNASAPGLQAESRSTTTGRAAQRLRHAFIVAQIALAFVLLAGAGLLGLSLRKVMTVSPGFRSGNILSGQLVLPVRSYSGRQPLLTVTERLTAEIGRQPGVQAVGFATNVPLSGISNKSAATVQGHQAQPGEAPHAVYSYSVGGDYFSALGFALREGRFLTADDSRRDERYCVVDEDFARRYWPKSGPKSGPLGSAIGQKVFEGGSAGESPDEAYTIVGVVGPVKQAGLVEDEAQGAVYYPFGHRMDHTLWLVVRTSLPPESLGDALRKAVRAVDPELPVTDVRSMDTRIADSLVTRRSPALLAGLFSAIAVLLTAIGTYGVLSYSVSHRRREIGLRMALGALPSQIRDQFLGLALRLLAAGMILGLVGAWLTGKAMQSILFHVPALNLTTLAGAAAILGVVSLIACLLPSGRAARISPMEVLAEE
jgi:predicted permease